MHPHALLGLIISRTGTKTNVIDFNGSIIVTLYSASL